MNSRASAIALLVGFPAVSLLATTPPAEIEVVVEQLHPNAIRVGSGSTYGDRMLAVASEKGLVVVDTGTTVRATRAYRAKIEEVFGRKDFRYVVNTHYHYDHMVGNPVFPEATVIAHVLTRERIIDEKGIDEAVAAFDEMLALRDGEYLISENAFNALGYRFLGESRIDAAVAVFEMNVRAFPESSNPWDSLGEGYAARGEIDRAIAAYERSVELDPGNSNGVAQLERSAHGE